MKRLIHGGTIINENRIFKGDILVRNDKIERIVESGAPIQADDAERIDATGKLVIPGVIDDQVHFREPGLTRKGDIGEGSRAAAAGGVTSFMDMPNVSPATTTNALLREKQEIAARTSVVNYSFYLGASMDNIEEIRQADPRTTCGVKVFMGSSTGNLLVDSTAMLERVFAESPLLVATHCEDNAIIKANLDQYKSLYGEDIPAHCHPLIRSRECCYASSSLAAALACEHQTRLHILHLSTKEEIGLLDTGDRKSKQVTGEVCVHHLWFSDEDYARLGSRIKCNPAIKTAADRQELRYAVAEGRIDVVATDHAPHLLAEKEGGALRAASGMPLVQHSLVAMLQLAAQGVFTVEQVVERMCHAPAVLYRIVRRGYIRPGYYADLALVHPHSPWTVSRDNIIYKCGWSPFEGTTFDAAVQSTWVNGRRVYDRGTFDENARGMRLEFDPPGR